MGGDGEDVCCVTSICFYSIKRRYISYKRHVWETDIRMVGDLGKMKEGAVVHRLGKVTTANTRESYVYRTVHHLDS